MKLRLLPILFLFLSLNFVKAQEVPQTQIPLITKVTATWCPPCGTWGWELFEELLEDNHDKALVLAAHYSGDLLTNAASDMASNFGANSQPRFILNNSDILANSANGAAKRAEVAAAVDEFNQQSPQLNTGLLVTRMDDTYTIKAKTEFFEEVSGNIHLSLLAVESDVINFQQSRGVVPHANVIRGNVGTNTFGAEIAQGTIAAGTVIEETYTLDLNGWNPDNVEIMALLWNNENGSYTYLNGNKVTETAVSSLNTIQANFNATWRSNGSENQIYLDAPESLGQTSIALYGINGQYISQIFNGKLAAGIFEFPVGLISEKGNYLVRIESEQGTVSLKVQ